MLSPYVSMFSDHACSYGISFNLADGSCNTCTKTEIIYRLYFGTKFLKINKEQCVMLVGISGLSSHGRKTIPHQNPLFLEV